MESITSPFQVVQAFSPGEAFVTNLSLFALTSVLEVVGTNLGTWHWVSVLPWVNLPMGDAPSAIGGAYCGLAVFSDLLARSVQTFKERVFRVANATASEAAPLLDTLS